jgi:hypothetical protein
MDRHISGFDEKNPMRDLVKFAADKSSSILIGERKRLDLVLELLAAERPVALSSPRTRRLAGSGERAFPSRLGAAAGRDQPRGDPGGAPHCRRSQ